jgi:hypothetical protein
MKNILSITLSFLLTFSIAIAQDGINYQGAATDVNGDELTNQNITIRASVLSASANGNLEWEETHSATTDQFGLFNVVIGQGTNTTNGAIASFDDMDWGSGNHFLKIEMDASGGTNYAMIGTTQMMSVPYALYAKSAGIDSTMLANMIGSSGGGMGGGCDLRSPDPINNITPVVLSLLSSYTVPNGKNLYLSVWTDITVNSSSLAINASQSVDNFLSPIFGSGDSIQCTSGGTTFGYLVDSSVEPIFISTSVYPSAAFVIPQNKIFVLLGSYGGCYINSFNNTVPNNMKNPIVVLAGDSIHRDGYSYQYGYLVDENYFANCGGGGSSSNSSSSMISTSIEFNSNLSSGTLGVGSSFSTNVVIDTLEIPANSMVDINGYYNRNGSSYASNTDSQIYFTDLTGNSLNFLTVSSSGFSSNNLSSSIIPNGDGMYVMKKFFSNATTIIIYSSLSGQHCCHAYLSGGGVSFSTSGFITINSY